MSIIADILVEVAHTTENPESDWNRSLGIAEDLVYGSRIEKDWGMISDILVNKDLLPDIILTHSYDIDPNDPTRANFEGSYSALATVEWINLIRKRINPKYSPTILLAASQRFNGSDNPSMGQATQNSLRYWLDHFRIFHYGSDLPNFDDAYVKIVEIEKYNDHRKLPDFKKTSQSTRGEVDFLIEFSKHWSRRRGGKVPNVMSIGMANHARTIEEHFHRKAIREVSLANEVLGAECIISFIKYNAEQLVGLGAENLNADNMNKIILANKVEMDADLYLAIGQAPMGLYEQIRGFRLAELRKIEGRYRLKSALMDALAQFPKFKNAILKLTGNDSLQEKLGITDVHDIKEMLMFPLQARGQ